MKSIVEEASTIEKAVTQAWTRTGKPKKFTITVFQEPEKNFFGMTTAPAKIGFMYEERTVQYKSRKRAAPRQQQTPQPAPQQRPKRYEQPRQIEPTQNQQPREQKNGNRFWTQEMIDGANKWLNDTLKMLNKQSISFSAKPNRYHLKVQFSQPLSDDARKEKAIFRSFAHLIMQAQRSAFKKAFKHHKVILMSS